MPAGEPFSREIQSREAPDELQYRVVTALSTLLAPAKYKLAADGAEGIEYHRRYVRPALAAAAGAMVAVAVGLTLLGHDALVLFGVVGMVLLPLGVARGTDVLAVRVEPRPGGSAAVLRGHLNGRGRMALLGVDPMGALPLRAARQLRVVESRRVP